MDPYLKQILLDTYEIMRHMVASPKCGFRFCAAASQADGPSACEHIGLCRSNHVLCEQIAALQRRVEHVETREGVPFLCTLKGVTK